jgi:hypothetical protein
VCVCVCVQGYTEWQHPVTRSLFWGAFAKLRKASSRFIMSVCLSVFPHGTTRLSPDGFSWNLVLEYFPKMYRENSGYAGNLTRIIVLYVQTNKRFIISCSVLLNMKSVWDKSCGKNQNKHFVVNKNCLALSYTLWDNVEKYDRAGQATYDKIRHLRFVCWIWLYLRAFDYIWLLHLGISFTVFVLICTVVILYCFVMCVCVGGGVCVVFVMCVLVICILYFDWGFS